MPQKKEYKLSIQHLIDDFEQEAVNPNFACVFECLYLFTEVSKKIDRLAEMLSFFLELRLSKKKYRFFMLMEKLNNTDRSYYYFAKKYNKPRSTIHFHFQKFFKKFPELEKVLYIDRRHIGWMSQNKKNELE